MRRILDESASAQDRTRGASDESSRKLRNGLIGLGVFSGLIVGLLLAVPGLRSLGDRIADANLAWVATGVGFELLSCAGYVLLFQLLFNTVSRFGVRLSLAELAVNSVVSASGLGGIALGAWILSSKGVATEWIAKRSVLLFVLTSAVNVGAVVVIGIPMWLGLLPGSRNALLTLLPAMLALATILATLALARWAEHRADRSSERHGRANIALLAISDGVGGAVRLIAQRNWRLLGAVGYWLFDTLVLYVCLVAYGPTPSFWVVAMAYLVGLLANSIPIPAGLIAVEGGLIGMLVLFGVRPASAVLAAVVTYRAISLWIPSVIGSIAFFNLRREIGEPVAAQPKEAIGG
jgi:uncharacterized protein (TIRG00374 family)